MAEKPKTPEAPDTEEVKTAEGVRKKIDILAELAGFRRTWMGTQIVRVYKLKSIAEVFEYEDVFFPVIAQLNALKKKIKPMHFRAFLLMAAEKYPDFIAEALENDDDFQIDDPETLEMVSQVLKEKGYELSSELTEEVSVEKSEIPESEPVDLEKYEGINDQTKENIAEKIAMLREFEKNKVCQELLATHDLASIFEIFTDKDVFNSVADHVFKLLEELDEFADDSVEKQGLYFIVMQPPPPK